MLPCIKRDAKKHIPKSYSSPSFFTSSIPQQQQKNLSESGNRTRGYSDQETPYSNDEEEVWKRVMLTPTLIRNARCLLWRSCSCLNIWINHEWGMRKERGTGHECGCGCGRVFLRWRGGPRGRKTRSEEGLMIDDDSVAMNLCYDGIFDSILKVLLGPC